MAQKILIVEDSALISLGIKKTLLKLDYEVLGPVNNGTDAIQVAIEQTPDLILMDIILSGNLDGIETVKKIREKAPIPVLYLTGHTDEQKVKRAKETNPLGFVVKPYKEVQLSIIIEMALQKAKVDKEIEDYKNLLEKKVEERTRELEISNLQLQAEVQEHILTEIRLEKAKERAEQSDKIKTAFLNNISHEIRTPLNAIMGFSNLLRDNYPNSTNNSYIDQIVNNGHSLIQLFEGIIELARIESGDIITKTSTCSVNEILNDVYIAFTQMQNREKKDIEFSLLNHCQADDLTIVSNSRRIKQILSYLLDNAFKFTEQGFIKIEAEISFMESDKYLLISVKDTGIGIAPDKYEYIFERFNKIQEGEKFYQGIGLGLSIAQSIANTLGGFIEVESEINKGSTFKLFLPLEIRQSRNNSYHLNGYPNWSKKTVLVVEDEMSNFKLIEAILQKTKIKIYHAKDGIEAIAYIKNNCLPDIILMDIMLPKQDGCITSQQIKKIDKSIPIIGQTAYPLIKKKALQSGCDICITKPLRPEDLIQTMHKFLNSW